MILNTTAADQASDKPIKQHFTGVVSIGFLTLFGFFRNEKLKVYNEGCAQGTFTQTRATAEISPEGDENCEH